MQLVNFFNQFMKDEVNLNQHRINTLDQKIVTLKTFLKNSDTFKDIYLDMFSQGSYKHKTIIKPPKSNKEFDADILLNIDTVEEWEDNPTEYIRELHKTFNVDRYKDILIKNTRCITLNYAGDYHIDIVPLVKRNGNYYIINRTDNIFEKTNPIEYTQWLTDNNKDSNYQLRKVIRLFKYMRDIKQNFTVKSILLNTLLGNQIYSFDKDYNTFSNLPTAFKVFINRLNDYLQNNPSMPNIYNPKMPEENFTRNWKQDQYANFRNKIQLYTDKTNEAYDEIDKKKSIEKWKSVFGHKFPEFTRSTKLESSNENYSNTEEFIENKVSSISLDYKLKIDCLVKGQNGIRDMLLNLVPILKAEKTLEFFIDKIDKNIPYGYEIHWKGKNEGYEAKKAGKLRGSIFKGHKSHTEPTKYKGTHFVECYIIKDNILIAMDRIDVPIEISRY